MTLIKTGWIEREDIRPTADVPLAGQRIPSADECEAILAEWWVDVRVVRHSRKVAEIAVRMAAALLGCGVEVNPELVQAAALLHDLAKGRPDHATTGALMLRSMGFDRVAEIVAAHTDLGGFCTLDEPAIVFLADKLVRDEELVTLEQRFKPALKRFRKDAVALANAFRRLSVATAVAQAVEKRLGMPLSRLLHEPTEIRDHDCLASALRQQEAETA